MGGRLETAPVQSCGKGGDRRPKGNALVMANVALKEAHGMASVVLKEAHGMVSVVLKEAPVMANVALKEAHGMASVVLKEAHEKGGRAVKVALSGRS